MYFVRDIAEDSKGKYWIGTEKGLFIYDISLGNFEHCVQSFDPTLASINDNAIYKVFKSRENVMWLGTYFGGLNFWESFEPGFKKILPGTKPDDLKGKALSQIIKGSDDKLWIATEDAGIAIFDPQNQTFRHILNNSEPNKYQTSNNIHALAIDPEGAVWSGNFWGGVNKINAQNYQIKNYSSSINNPSSLINNSVFSLFFDSSDILWVGTMNGIDCFDKKENRFTHFKPGKFRDNFIYDIFQDNEKDYWFCTYDDGLYRYNRTTDSLFHYQKDSTRNLNTNSFISHCIDSRGKVWFGTRDGGLVQFDPKSRSFTAFDMNSGLPNNDIYGILEDDHNNLWLSSNKGISKFNPETGEIENYTVDHGLVGNQFNFKSYLKTKDGTMYFGAVNGLTYFHPDQIKIFESRPKIHFTGFRIFNENPIPGENSILKKDIDFTDEITLKYNQNVISFDFIALDYHSEGKNNFSYYMEGLESSWRLGGNQRSTTYNNLLPGHYTFHIKATNIYNFPNELERTIKITVLPPFWKTLWAYLFYVVFLAFLVFLLYRYIELRHKEKMSLKIEKIENEKLQELQLHRNNFFTFISHEFKTPLTIIVASIDSFFSIENISSEFKERLVMVKRNVLRLQFLLNQLMDFRKIESDHETVNLQDGDVIHFLKEIFNTFSTLFKKKDLEYILISQHEKLYIGFDPDKLEKIVSNLLSNAYKHTPEHGKITLQIETLEKDGKPQLAIIISDIGNGMTAEQSDQIFNLFYKIEDNQNEYQGSGIGLTLTQSLINFLNGHIEVESKLGEGTTFTVILPYVEGKDPPNSGDIQIDKSVFDDLLQQVPNEESTRINENCKSDFGILFVDDNKDLLKFLCDHFRKKYKVRDSANGLEAIKSIQKNIPDVVVTDLMMPQMDGFALCKELKTNFEYSHIPVIILTSKADIQARLESLGV
jgi:signal transduction histidine kinase/CheY-like chemotaxis protein